MMIADFTYSNHGTVWTLRPMTEAAGAWCAEYLPEDCPMWGDAYVIEHRYIGDILIALVCMGLEAERE